MVDRTVYPDKDKVPELALRQIFGRQKLPESLCLLMADKGMLLVERVAMLGDSIASVKATLKAIVGDDTKFGADAPAQELSLTLLTTVWKSASAKIMRQHPDMILTYMWEPHRKFVERIHRDYLVHGAVAFYEVGEMLTRADRIVQTSGFSKTSDDLLRVVQSDNKVAIASDSDVMDRLHAFFIALEYLNICDFTIAAGPLKYLSELEEWRHENRGLAVLLAADSLIRKEVYKLNNDKRKEFPSFSLALQEEKEKQISKGSSTVKLTEKIERDQRVPEKEWKKIMSFTYTGARRPPGNFSPPPAVVQPAAAANDARSIEPTAAQCCAAPPWGCWSQVPRDPDLIRDLGPWCLEIFSGSAGLSSQWRLHGLQVLPPIDVTRSDTVQEPTDILDAEFFSFVLLLCRMGAVLGTPCSSFSLARSRPGGPPPVRSKDCPLGLDSVPVGHRWQLLLANELLFRSLELFEAVVQSGGDASLENPLRSLMWQVPQVQQLRVRLHLYNVDLDQCQFGSAFRKPTRILVSNAQFLALALTCRGDHPRTALKGRLRLRSGEVVFMTKLAQEYPSEFCKAFAQVTKSVVDHTLPQFRPSYQLLAPKVDRKRRIGDPVTWKGHRQEQAARLACSSGYQLKRGAAKPLLDVECEPGLAVQWSLDISHPFTVQPSISEEILQNIKTIAEAPTPLLQRRRDRLQFWQQRAKDLLPATDQELRSIADPCLRRLLRGVPDYVDLQMGSCTHVTLYDELFAAAKCPDPLLLQGIRNGFPIVGEIQRSGRWPPFTKNQDPVSVQDALDRAWEFRSKIFRR
eukprot:s3342_g6.t2